MTIRWKLVAAIHPGLESYRDWKFKNSAGGRTAYVGIRECSSVLIQI
jgi:hypothetical protein